MRPDEIWWGRCGITPSKRYAASYRFRAFPELIPTRVVARVIYCGYPKLRSPVTNCRSTVRLSIAQRGCALL